MKHNVTLRWIATLRWQWGRRRFVEHALRKITSRRRAFRLARLVP